MKILVAYGSERGGTAEIAAQVGATLRGEGFTVDVFAARRVRDLRAYDAVVLGAALYAFRWHPDAQRFVVRHARALRERQIWFFSSGPLDHSASEHSIPPTPQVLQLMNFVGANGHTTFGGRLAPDARGFVASKMARNRSGDWRDAAMIETWSRAIAQQLRDGTGSDRARREFTPLPSRTVPVALSLLAGLSAVAGGATLMARPDGSLLRMPLSVLVHSPFRTFFAPGLLLLVVVGLGNLCAVLFQIRRSAFGSVGSFVAGAALIVWIIVEMVMLRSAHWLQLTYLALGIAIVTEAMREGAAIVRSMSPPNRTTRATA